MKHPYLSIVLAAVIGAAGAWLLQAWQADSVPPSQPPTVEQVQKLSSLVVLKVNVADVVACRLGGYTGGVRAVIVVRGDVEIATNLQAAQFVSVDPAQRRAVLVLPPPQPRRPRVDHDRTRVWSVDWTGLWNIVPGRSMETRLLDQAMERAQQVVAQTGQQPDLAEQARRQAELALSGFFEALDWQVLVKWADRPIPTTTSPVIPG